MAETPVIALMATRQLSEGSEAQIQAPHVGKEEEPDGKAMVQGRSEQREPARPRLCDLLPPLAHKLADKNRTEIVGQRVQPLEEAGHCPQADSACEKLLKNLNERRRLEQECPSRHFLPTHTQGRKEQR